MTNGITRDTFKDADVNGKLGILYDELQDLKNKVNSQKWKNGSLQLIGSFVGGFIAIVTLGKITIFK